MTKASDVERVVFAVLESIAGLVTLVRLLTLLTGHASRAHRPGPGGCVTCWCCPGRHRYIASATAPDDLPSTATAATAAPVTRRRPSLSWRHVGLIVITVAMLGNALLLVLVPGLAEGDSPLVPGVVGDGTFYSFWAFLSGASTAALGIVLRLFVAAQAKFHAPTRRVLLALDVATAVCAVVQCLVIVVPADTQASLSTAMLVIYIVAITVGLSVYSVTTLSLLMRSCPPHTQLGRSTRSLLNAIRVFRYLLGCVATMVILSQLIPLMMSDKNASWAYTNPINWAQNLAGQVAMAWVLGRVGTASSSPGASNGSHGGGSAVAGVAAMLADEASIVALPPPPVLISPAASAPRSPGHHHQRLASPKSAHQQQQPRHPHLAVGLVRGGSSAASSAMGEDAASGGGAAADARTVPTPSSVVAAASITLVSPTAQQQRLRQQQQQQVMGAEDSGEQPWTRPAAPRRAFD